MQKINGEIKPLKYVFLVSLSLSLSACGLWPQQDSTHIDTANLSQLENAHTHVKNGSTSAAFHSLRARALQEAAMSISAQGGLAYASEQINFKLEKDKKYLDSIYNFDAMLLSHGVLPPVLESGDNNLNLNDPNTIRVADRSYKIISQARFVTTPPNWRDYLKMTYIKPELPDKTLLPKDDAEQKVWREGIRSGWGKGIEQSYSIFQQNLARLKRDYNGMILYRKLLQERMISQPFVSRTELGVTGDGSNMRINDQVLRIVELPELQTNSKGWNAIVVKRND